jgi:dipeptidyl aminopeptidase/acylaminoacyl peptidase
LKRWSSWSCVALALAARIGDAQQAQRPMTVDDLLGLSAVGGVAVSPDGEWVATVVIRPGSNSKFGCTLCNYQTLSDIWIGNRRTGERRNITRGDSDESGSWLPVWSPSGRRLAFVSSKPERGEPRGGNNVRPYVWDAARNSITRLSDRGVYLQADVDRSGESRQFFTWLHRAVNWVNDSTLLAVMLGDGEVADEQVLPWRKGVNEASRAWRAWEEGRRPTASVLESRGRPSVAPMVELRVIDVPRARNRLLGEVPKWDLADLNLRLQVSVAPDRRRASVLAIRGTIEMRPERRLLGELRIHSVGSVNLDSSGIRWAAIERFGEGVGGQLMGWSPDSRSFAFTQQVEPWVRPTRQIAVAVSIDGTVWSTPPAMTVDTIAWTVKGELLAYARTFAQRGSRWDWWRLDAAGSPVNLTASMRTAPDRLFPTTTPTRFVGVSDSAVWAIHTERDSAVRITERLLPPNATVVWASPRGELLAQARTSAGRTLSRVTGGTIAPVVPPNSGAVLADLDENGKTLAFTDDTPSGVFVWMTDGRGERPVRAMSLNEHVAGIAQGKRMLFAYRGADGDSLTGLAVLPPGYDSAKRYPLAVWAYGGFVVRDTNNSRLGKNYVGTFNMEVLAAHGYVVLFPSMPLAFGVKSDVWTDMPKGVMPAIDRLIELGIADPDRLAVLGHSFGGYSTYAIVTQTNRFKAAVAMSGHPDLISLYGQFLPSERYSDRAHEGMVTASISEYGPFNMGGSLWDDAWHYQRNSPLFYMDRVRTPLMIVHGDMDGAPIQQGEEAFTAMYRLGRRAKFVRYWGEGHVVGSPPNVRHLWSQIFDWLDTHLGTKQP